MTKSDDELMSYCRQCGGERYHRKIAEREYRWNEPEDGGAVGGTDVWSIVECGGCRTVTFVHSHWFSEDCEMTEDGPEPIVYRDLYPPAPSRKVPEWGTDFYLAIKADDIWIVKMHADIYTAIGMKAYGLAAIGTRAIVDFLVTSNACGRGSFKEKLKRLSQINMITDAQVDVIYAAFDAGSAAAHRGYSPAQEDVFTLLDITESLLHKIYIEPMRQRRQAEAAAALKLKTPQRPNSKNDP